MFEQFQSKFIDANGIRTHYVEQGEGDALILVHGGGAGADGRSNYETNIPLFARHLRVIAYDMVGFGLTDKPDPATFAYTQQTRTDHLVAFIRALGLKKVSLIGNSMGGTTAMGAALTAPELVDKLVLMGAAVNMTHDMMVQNRPNLASVLSYDDTKDGMRRIVDALTYNYTATEEMISYRYEASIDPEAKAAYKATMGWAFQNGLCFTDDDFASLRMPVLVVGGKNDIMVPIERTCAVMFAIPQAWGTVFPECGHWVMIEYAKAFCDLTLRFLGKID